MHIKQCLFFIVFFMPLMGMAQSPKSIYQTSLTEKPSGVYEQAPWLFFVIKQPCLTSKQFAGTAESKAAEGSFYAFLANEVTLRNVSLNHADILFQEPLKSDIIAYIAKEFSPLSSINHQLLIDRNSEAQSCIREYVQVAKLAQFSAKVAIPAFAVKQATAALIINAVKRKDYKLLSSYFQAIHLPHLSIIYRELSNKDILPINLNLKDISENTFPKCNDASYCSQTARPFSDSDIHGVIGHVLHQKGLAKITNMNPSKALAEDYFTEAQKNFSQGQNAEKIIEDLTLSLNLNPSKPAAWKMLSNIFRAIDKPSEALSAAHQYVLQQPNDIESWLYIYKTLEVVDLDESQRLSALLRSLESNFKFSPWATKQLKVES